MHTYMHALICTHTCMHSYTHIHACTHMHTYTHAVHDPAVKVVQSRAVSAMLSNSAVEPSFRSLIASTMGGE